MLNRLKQFFRGNQEVQSAYSEIKQLMNRKNKSDIDQIYTDIERKKLKRIINIHRAKIAE